MDESPEKSEQSEQDEQLDRYQSEQLNKIEQQDFEASGTPEETETLKETQSETVVEPEIAQQVEQTKPIGQPEQKIEHQTAGVIVLQWLTYAFWGWLIIGLIWMLSLILMDFIYESGLSSASETLPYAISAIVVLLPVAFILDLFYRRHEPAKKVGAGGIIMIIHAVIFALLGIGVLIASIFVSLNAIIKGSFSDGQIVAVFTLLGATLLYVIAFLRTLRPAKLARFTAIYGISMLVVSAAMLTMGAVGPLASSIQTRDDRRIEDNLNSINVDIQSYIQNNNKAPGSLDEVDFSSKDSRELVGDGLVKYKNDGIDANSDVGGTTHRYQLCVTYTYSNQSDAQYYDSPQKANDDLPYEGYISEFHPKGEVCYRLKETYYSNNLLEEYRYNPDALNGIVN